MSRFFQHKTKSHDTDCLVLIWTMGTGPDRHMPSLLHFLLIEPCTRTAKSTQRKPSSRLWYQLLQFNNDRPDIMNSEKTSQDEAYRFGLLKSLIVLVSFFSSLELSANMDTEGLDPTFHCIYGCRKFLSWVVRWCCICSPFPGSHTKIVSELWCSDSFVHEELVRNGSSLAWPYHYSHFRTPLPLISRDWTGRLTRIK